MIMAMGGTLKRRRIVAVATTVALGALAVVAGGSGASKTQRNIYWATEKPNGKGGVGVARLDGSHRDAHLVTGQDAPCGLASDGRHLYLPNSNNPSGNGPYIARVNLDGTHLKPHFIAG